MQSRWILVALLTISLACGDEGGGTAEDGGTSGDGGLGDVSCPRDPAVCGNGVLEPGESCDDGNTDPGDGCDENCSYEPDTPPEPECDLTGHWMAEKITVSEATLGEGILATTHNYFYYHIVQDGDAFEIVDSLHCGFFVDALVQVSVSTRTREALRCINDSDGREGTSAPSGDECTISFDTFYAVRGLSPPDYWLDDDWAGASTGEGTPSKADPENPDCECNTVECVCDDTGRYDPGSDTPGWEDWDQDGNPGITLRPGDDEWYVHMRDWDRYMGTVPQEASGPPQEFRLDVEWSNVTTVMGRVGAITSDEDPARDEDHHVNFKRMADAPDRDAMGDAELCQMVAGAFGE
ncbi:MAG: hypothetical protein ACODAU_03535 [Myxococcota bacterium]